MNEYEFQWRNGKKQIVKGHDPVDALNRAGYWGADIPDFDWYRELVKTPLGKLIVAMQGVLLEIPFFAYAYHLGVRRYIVLLNNFGYEQWADAPRSQLMFDKSVPVVYSDACQSHLTYRPR